jgi:uncharacterized membrane protein
MSSVEPIGQAEAPNGSDVKPVWTYGGYQLGNDNFTTALVHLYRGEIQRANMWRNRLDVTTNWAVVSTGAAITYAFGEVTAHHSVILLITVLVTLFLFIEARRLRYYELWSYRARLIETDFFAAMLVPPFRPHPEWSDTLASSLLRPELPISMGAALGTRFRRNYVWIYLVLAIAWLTKLAAYPMAITSWTQLPVRASIGQFPGWIVLALWLVFYVILIGVGLFTAQPRQVWRETPISGDEDAQAKSK